MKFSVLLPTRNGAKYLKSCIDSVLSQDYRDMELIVFDNANTDKFAHHHPDGTAHANRHPHGQRKGHAHPLRNRDKKGRRDKGPDQRQAYHRVYP